MVEQDYSDRIPPTILKLLKSNGKFGSLESLTHPLNGSQIVFIPGQTYHKGEISSVLGYYDGFVNDADECVLRYATKMDPKLFFHIFFGKVESSNLIYLGRFPQA